MNVASWVRRLALLSLFVVGAVGSEAAAESRNPLAEHVRAANDRFKDVSVAVAEGYAPIPCASGIDGGAMGVHYVNPNYLKDTTVDIKRPQAVMYEPTPDGKMALVAVEYIQFKGPASLEGQLFNFIGAPNRYEPVLRIARVGLEGEPAWHVRRHESERDMRPRDNAREVTHRRPKAHRSALLLLDLRQSFGAGSD